jgi:hypothetical protein
VGNLIPYLSGEKKARRLKALVQVINESGKYRAEIVPGYYNTDRKAGRLRIPGKGRTGNRLIVRSLKNDVVFDHNAADTYRCNGEVEVWVEDHITGKGCRSATCPACGR